MFKFFKGDDQKPVSKETQSDALNETATRIAIEIIQEKGGKTYLEGMKRIFKKTPEMIEDVDPQYREQLRKILGEESR